MDDYIDEQLKDAPVLFDSLDGQYAFVSALNKWLNVNGAEYCLGLADMRNLMENDLLYFAPVPFIQHVWDQRDTQRAALEPHTTLKYKDGPIILHNTGDTPAIIECKHIVNFAINKGWELQLV
jgi:hypothetical protein